MGIKLKDLKFGELNDIKRNNSNPSGDRRRTSASTAIRMATEKAFEVNTLVDVNTFTGFVVGVRLINRPISEYKDTIVTFQETVITEGSDTEVKNYLYKVYIPELEPLPAPKSYQDPVIGLYADVSLAKGTAGAGHAIAPGDLVEVTYANIATLSGPKITRVISPPVAGGMSIAAPKSSRSDFNNGKKKLPPPPATTERVPSPRALLPNGSPQADLRKRHVNNPPYILPIGVSRFKGDRMYLNDTINPVTKVREKHQALDFASPAGTPILAIADGVVTYTRTLSDEGGNYIVLRHVDVVNGGDMWVRNLHMNQPTTLKVDDTVTQGQVIGYVGTTGRSTGNHLHFELGKTYPGTYKGNPTKSTIAHKINPIGYYPEGWIVTHAGQAYVFEDIMREAVASK